MIKYTVTSTIDITNKLTNIISNIGATKAHIVPSSSDNQQL